MDVSSSRFPNFGVENTHQPEALPKSHNLSVLQKTAMIVALAALAGIVPSVLAGSFAAGVIYATIITAGIAALAIATILSKRASNSSKSEVEAPTKPAEPVVPAEETPKPDASLQVTPKEKPLPLLLLPNEFLANLCTFLPLKALGHLGLINKRFADFLGSETLSGQHTWKLIANKLGAPLISPSEVTPKEQVKNLFIEYPQGTVDLLNNKMIMKERGDFELFEKVFTKYVPEGFYLEYYVGFGAHCILYREGDKVKHLLTPGKMGKETWGPGEAELYESIKETNNCFEIVSPKK